MELKKLVLLCQHKLYMKSTTSLYSEIQQCQVHQIFVFFYVFYCNLKEKYHIKRNVDSKKRNVYTENQYYYFDLPKIRVGQARATKN